MMSDPKETYCYDKTPVWMRDVVVFMPCGLKLEGEYTGYGCVKTGETKISRYCPESFHDRKRRRYELKGVSPICTEYPAEDRTSSDDDPAWFAHNQWLDNHIWGPGCYHRACWEAVGSPEGWRVPSFRSKDQGFGSAGSLNFTNGFKGWDKDDVPMAPPQPGPEAIQLWAVNTIVYMIAKAGAWFRYQEWVEREREMRRTMDECKELMKKIDVELADAKEQTIQPD
jgi:hypothetical protein